MTHLCVGRSVPICYTRGQRITSPLWIAFTGNPFLVTGFAICYQKYVATWMYMPIASCTWLECNNANNETKRVSGLYQSVQPYSAGRVFCRCSCSLGKKIGSIVALLIAHSLSYEIAFKLGFKYPQHFTRLFKQRVANRPMSTGVP